MSPWSYFPLVGMCVILVGLSASVRIVLAPIVEGRLSSQNILVMSSCVFVTLLSGNLIIVILPPSGNPFVKPIFSAFLCDSGFASSFVMYLSCLLACSITLFSVSPCISILSVLSMKIWFCSLGILLKIASLSSFFLFSILLFFFSILCCLYHLLFPCFLSVVVSSLYFRHC